MARAGRHARPFKRFIGGAPKPLADGPGAADCRLQIANCRPADAAASPAAPGSVSGCAERLCHQSDPSDRSDPSDQPDGTAGHAARNTQHAARSTQHATRSTLGVYFAGIGLVWAAWIAATSGGKALALDAQTLGFGLLAGTFSVTANIALVRALARLDAAVGATIYRLNFAAVMALAVPILGETLNVPKVLGMVAALLAVLLFARNGPKAARPAPAGARALAGAASLTRACMGITYKLAFQHHVQNDGFLFANALCWIAGGLLWGALAERRLRCDRRTALFAVASGLLIVEIVITLAHGLQVGDASVVVPVTQLSFLATAILAALFLRERFTATRLAALACGIAAVVALAYA